MYCPERVIEIPWGLRKVRELPTSAHILEVGDVLGSTFARLGYVVDTIDLAPPRPIAVRGWTYLQTDAREFEADKLYDAAFSISTIEHIGMGRYGDPVDRDGDRTTLIRMARALRPRGHLYLTVPFGPVAEIAWQRTYDTRSMGSLLENWSINQMQVYVFDRWRWRLASGSEPEDSETCGIEGMHVPAVALVSATKIDH